MDTVSSSKFPEKHTEEEELLLQQYALLKNLRKQLTDLRSRQAAEAETSREKEETPAKTSEDARVAAERLVKSGKIKIQSACQPRVLMKKGRDSSGPAAYRPYSPTGGAAPSSQLAADDPQASAHQPPQAKRPRANLYDSFVSAGIPDQASGQQAAAAGGGPGSGEPARRGNTLFVQGYNIHQDMLRAAFSPFGAISRISMETRGRFNDGKANKPKAFITFESDDDAGNALEQLDGQLVKGSVLSVRLARKQPSSGPQHWSRGGGGPSDWGASASFDGGGGGRRRGGLGYDAGAVDDDDAGFSSPRYAPPDDSAAAAVAAVPALVAATAAAAAATAEDADAGEQRRPLQYSDGVFVSSDPMEEDAVVELDEVM